MRRAIYLLVLAFVAGISALLGTVAGGVIVLSILETEEPAQEIALTPAPAEQINLNISTVELQTAITRAVEEVGPAVVTVIADASGQTVSGSGVIISSQGYLLTNNHVVEGTNRVVVILADGTELPADIIGTDMYADLAVLQTQGEFPTVAILGNSDTLKPGETVIAIGLTGDVVGINTLVVRGSGFSNTIAEGLGFAIPINTARVVAEQILEKGYVARPYLGIRWQSIHPRIAQTFNLPVEWGTYISDVLSGSPAHHRSSRRNSFRQIICRHFVKIKREFGL
jgi:2-alkenal reductase